MDLREMCQSSHSKAAEHTFFSGAHGTFARIGHMLVHKTGLNKYKTEINTFPTTVVLNYKKTEKFTKMWKLTCY